MALQGRDWTPLAYLLGKPQPKMTELPYLALHLLLVCLPASHGTFV